MRWIVRLLHSRRLERELHAELQDHVEREVARLVHGGLPELEARRRARLVFGGVEQVKEQCRDERRPRLASEIAQDVRFAVRSFRRQPLVGSAFVLIVGLAIGANAAIFSVVDTILLKSLPLPRAEELAILWKSPQHGKPVSGVSPANIQELQSRLQAAASVAAMTMTSLVVTSAGDAERVSGVRVSSNFFTTLGVAPAVGRAFVSAEDVEGAERVAVISYALWRRHFGGARDVIGRSLVTGAVSYRVVGVMPSGFRFPELFGAAFRPDVWIPLQFSRAEAAARGAGYMFIVVRRQADRSWPLVQQELDAVSAEYARIEPRAFGGLHLRAIPFHEQVVGELRPVLFTLWGAVACVLAMACANVANLLLSRATARQRELAVRSSLGASRGRLWRQLLTENIVLGAVSCAVGLLLAAMFVRLGGHALGEVLPRAGEIAIDFRVVLFTAGMALAASLAIGSLPALYLGSVAPQDSLRGSTHGQTPAAWASHTRRALLVGQIAAAVFLATSAGLLVRSLAAVQRVDLGFRPDGLLTFSIALPETARRAQAQIDRARAVAFYERLIERLRELPQVMQAGAANALPMDGTEFGWGYEVQDKPIQAGTALPKADVRIVTPDALPAMDVQPLKGRGFARTDTAGGEPVAIVNAAFARQMWDKDDPLDKRIKLAGPANPWMRVVGIVPDVHLGAPDVEPPPAIYRPHAQHAWSSMAIVVRTVGPPDAAVPAVRATVRSVDPVAAMLEVRDFTYYLSKSVAERRLITLVMTSFATVANVLALAGVYALFAYLVTLRTREMGIRLTLGARGHEVVWLVLRQALGLCIVGLTLGLLVSASVGRILESHLFNIASTDLTTLAGVSIAILLAAALASYLPARRASRIDLTTALRTE